MDKIKLIEAAVTEIVAGCRRARASGCICWPPEHICFSAVPLPEGGIATFTVALHPTDETTHLLITGSNLDSKPEAQP